MSPAYGILDSATVALDLRALSVFWLYGGVERDTLQFSIYFLPLNIKNIS